MSRLIIVALLASVAFGVRAEEPKLPVPPVAQQQAAAPAGEGSSFVQPPEDADAEHDDDGDEWTTDMNQFLAQGYTIPHWDTYSQYTDQIAADVVLPDWRKRNANQPEPTYPSIDVAAAMITNGDYNDLIVRSRLPGDCTDVGCLVQIYSLVGKVWIKKYEFRSLEFAYKEGTVIGTTILGLVGNEHVPSRIVTWDGSTFNSPSN